MICCGTPVGGASWCRARENDMMIGMRNEFTAIIEEGWFIAYCPEVPGANGQGRTKDEAVQSLASAIEMILDQRREDGLRGVPATAIRETVTVG